MEKNCLVTKYKATVNDNSLLKVGEMLINIIKQKCPTNKTNQLQLYNGGNEDIVFEVENGEENLTLDSNMESGWTNKITVPKNSNVPVYVRNGNYRVKIFPKYAITQVGNLGVTSNAILIDTKYLKYSENIKKIYAPLSGDAANISGLTNITDLGFYHMDYSRFTGKLSDLTPLTSLTTLIISSASLTGKLSDLTPLTSLTTLDLSYTNISSDISELNSLSSLTTLRLGNSPNITGDIKNISIPLTFINIGSTQVIGDLVEFVKTQRKAGRTTGSLSSDAWGINITFNGIPYKAVNQKLTWTDSTISLGDETIEM